MADRKSEAEKAHQIIDEDMRAKAEVENGFRQFDAAMDELQKWIKTKKYRLKPSLLLKLNRITLDGIHEHPGVFRPGKIIIRGSGHQPPSPEDVAELVEEFCDYINDNWDRKSANHLSAYAMWRLNWIHPFADGNGRTSRMVSYLILCAKLGNQIPGSITIPEQISENKKPYYDALEYSDSKFLTGKVDVTEMEELLDSYLAKQLVEIHENAAGKSGREKSNKEVERHKVIKSIEDHPVIVTSIVAFLLGVLTIVFT